MNPSNPRKAGAGIRYGLIIEIIYSFNYITYSYPIRSGGGGGRGGLRGDIFIKPNYYNCIRGWGAVG